MWYHIRLAINKIILKGHLWPQNVWCDIPFSMPAYSVSYSMLHLWLANHHNLPVHLLWKKLWSHSWDTWRNAIQQGDGVMSLSFSQWESGRRGIVWQEAVLVRQQEGEHLVLSQPSLCEIKATRITLSVSVYSAVTQVQSARNSSGRFKKQQNIKPKPTSLGRTHYTGPRKRPVRCTCRERSYWR